MSELRRDPVTPFASEPRTARDELADASSGVGRVYLRRLRRAQLALSLVALVAFGGLVGSLPLVLYLVPGLFELRILEVPVSIALLVVVPYALFLALGALYQRRADALDVQFRDVVEEP